MTPAVLSRPASLIEAIEERAKLGPLSEIEAARFAKAARALSVDDPAAGHAALGVLASLRADAGVCRREHECALRLRPSDPVLEAAYADSLRRLGLLPDAFGRIEAALAGDPLSKRYLDVAVPLAYMLDVPELGELLERWRRLVGKSHPIERDLAEEDEDAAAVRLGREEIAQGGGTPWAMLRAEGLFCRTARYAVVLSSAAAESFRRLSPRKAKQVCRRLDELGVDPKARASGLGRLTRSRKIRVGPVLILYDIHAEEREVLLTVIARRDETYAFRR